MAHRWEKRLIRQAYLSVTAIVTSWPAAEADAGVRKDDGIATADTKVGNEKSDLQVASRPFRG